MAKNYTSTFTRRVRDGGKDFHITLEIDTGDLLMWLGVRAARNKSKRTFYLDKAVKVTAQELKA